ncbi:MAG: beta strand repeat-containing protein [Phycisphaerales bacterium]
MSRYSITTLALAAGLATTGAAFGQTVLQGTAQPQNLAGDRIAAPTTSILRIEENGADEFANAPATITIELLEGGSVIAGTGTPFTSATQINGGAPTFAGGQDIITIDMSGIGAWGFVLNANPNADGFRVTIDDGSATDTIDFEIDNGVPTLVEAIYDDTTGSEQLFLIFDRALANGSGDNDANETTAADIASLDDFELSTDAAVTTPIALDGSLVSNPNIIGTGNGISYDVDTPGAFSFGLFIRSAGSGEITGINGRTTGVDVETLVAETPLSLVSVNAVETIGNGGTGDFRFTFNQSIGDPGNAAFFLDNTSWTLGGNAITPDAISATAIDSNNSDSILVTVNLPAGAGVEADGLDDSDDGYEVTLTSGGAGNPPQTVLGTDYAETDEVATVGDAIAPTLVGPLGVWDANGDGVIDAFGLIFDEPMGTPGSSATVLGAFEFETQANSTIHPYSLFLTNLANGETDPFATANEVDIATDGTTTFNADSLALLSEDSSERLGTDNIVAVLFDPAAVDWNGDGTVDAADADLFPGTFDTGWATLAMTAMDAGLADANGNAYDSDLTATAANDDFAPAILSEVWFRDAENDFDDQLWFEQFSGVGDTQADAAIMIFNEEMDTTGGGPGNFETSYSFGPSASERFQNGDFVGIGTGPFQDNVVIFRDFSGSGWDLGDTLTVAGTNNGLIDDNGGNDFTGGSGVSMDRTSPYVPRQFDINGNQIFGAYVNPASDGSVESFSLIFTKPVEFIDDMGAALATLDDVAQDFEVDGDAVDSVSVSGNVVTLVPMNAGNLLASSSFDIFYDGEVADRRLAEAGAPANVVDTDGTITAQPIAEPDIDGEFVSVMDVFGAITNNGNPVPAGTQVYGMLAVQRVHTITFTLGGVTGVIDYDSSAEAFTNFILGLEPYLYMIDDDADVWFTNDRDDNYDENHAVLQVSVQVNRGEVRWNARGLTYTEGDSPQQNQSASGTATLVWDVLRSNDGTAYGLVNSGFQINDTPISSKAVITGNDGEYLLHVTGPNSRFNGRTNTSGAPVIIVVEKTNGERLMATSIHNGADGLGTLQFNPFQNQNDPSEGRFDGALDIEFNNIGMEWIIEGWNATAFNRNSGFGASSNGLPASVPAGVTPFVNNATNNTIVVGTTLTQAPAYLQWGFYVDDDNDGVWTRDDDFNGLLSSTLVDPRGFDDFFAFTLTDRGVKTNNNIDGLVGGYGLGTFYGGFSADSLGVFQYGAERASGTALFGSNGFNASNTNLGWALVTSPGDASDVDAFLSANEADFLIEFNRTDTDEVTITTFDGAGAGTGDTSSVNRGQAYFVHFE